MPSFCIRDCSVERLIPSRVAAPFGPATIQLVCSSAATICWRSASSRTARIFCEPPAGLVDGPRALGEDHRSFDHVLQLTDVARPWVFDQRRHGFGRNGMGCLAAAPPELLD